MSEIGSKEKIFMDLKVKNTAEYKNISLEETLAFLQTTADGLTTSESTDALIYLDIMK